MITTSHFGILALLTIAPNRTRYTCNLLSTMGKCKKTRCTKTNRLEKPLTREWHVKTDICTEDARVGSRCTQNLVCPQGNKFYGVNTKTHTRRAVKWWEGAQHADPSTYPQSQRQTRVSPTKHPQIVMLPRSSNARHKTVSYIERGVKPQEPDEQSSGSTSRSSCSSCSEKRWDVSARKRRLPLRSPPRMALRKSTTERLRSGVQRRCKVDETRRGKSFTIEPGPICIDGDLDTGCVHKVNPGSQAENLGIRTRMTIKAVDGLPYSEDILYFEGESRRRRAV